MRNLRNILRSSINFSNTEASPLTASCWDTSDGSLICAFGPTEHNALVELKRIPPNARSEGDIRSIASWDVPCPHPELKCDKIVNLHNFPDTATICLVFAGGDIVLIREQPLAGEELLEIVGSVDAGIEAAEWSPDDELLAIVTTANTFLLMSRDFEGVADVVFAAEDERLSKHVNVGWGKKETQFQGKRVKSLRDPTMPETIDAGLLSGSDRGGVSVSWRGDGQYVAVNSIEQGKRRMIRVYSRDGILDSVSEPVDYLEGALSWRPAGNLIAGIQRRKEVTQVAFFERNGLRHGEFSLRPFRERDSSFNEAITLTWNVDSTVLAVSFADRVQLWTMSNYHYYLKQEISLPAPRSSSRPLGVHWHPEKPLTLAVHNDAGMKLLDYCFAVAKGSTCSPNDYGAIAVIDGKTLKITPLRTANVPPPMALHEVTFDGQSSIVDVAFNNSGTSIAVLHHDRISFLTYDPRKRQPGPTEQTAFTVAKGEPYQIAALGNNEFCYLTHDSARNEDSIKMVGTQALNDKAVEGFVLEIPKQISSISANLDQTALFYQDIQNRVGPVTSTNDLNSVTLGSLCPWLEVVSSNDETTVFGLSTNGRLYSNNRVLASNCTSFLVTPAHLIFTTTNHLVKFVHLTRVEDLDVPPDEPGSDERCRNIERGARLVTVIPSIYCLILQMPRGNLETIYPRALVLASIRKSISERDYNGAFLACRNQRVDMNILHDYAPEQFMANVPFVIKQLRKVEYIDLFLSQLRNEDVSQTMYKETIKPVERGLYVNGALGSEKHHDRNEEISDLTGSKVNRVCNAFLAALTNHTSTNLQNIITAHVCKSPPDLEGGLRVVAELRSADEDLAEKAAEHICFLADVNQLYDCALGMYDLGLTLIIAQQSQKDPREYLPYLQSLQEMDDLRRQFIIDNDLGRRESALKRLHEMNAFDELQAYAEKHELYGAAIELCKYEAERLEALMHLYASFLVSRNRFKEAAVAYEFLKDYGPAATAYKAANMWREALYCATMVPFSQSELHLLASDLADGLLESKDYAAAATIFLEYQEDLEGACRSYCKAYLFADAMRIAGLHRQPDLLNSVVDPGLIECFNSITELLADCKSQLVAQIPRLRQLRVKKEQDPLAFYAGDAAAGEANGDIPDNVSLAPTDASTSGGTFMTRYTGRTNGTLNTQTTRKTSKNRRREERKRARGKEGSVYEEEYLVNSVGRLIERVNSVNGDVTRLIEALMRRRMREQARAVEVAMVELTQRCKDVIPEVYQVEEKKPPTTEEHSLRPTGADAVLYEALEGDAKKDPPVVKIFERFCLLS